MRALVNLRETSFTTTPKGYRRSHDRYKILALKSNQFYLYENIYIRIISVYFSETLLIIMFLFFFTLRERSRGIDKRFSEERNKRCAPTFGILARKDIRNLCIYFNAYIVKYGTERAPLDKAGAVRSLRAFSFFLPFSFFPFFFYGCISQPRDAGRAPFINRVTL